MATIVRSLTTDRCGCGRASKAAISIVTIACRASGRLVELENASEAYSLTWLVPLAPSKSMLEVWEILQRLFVGGYINRAYRAYKNCRFEVCSFVKSVYIYLANYTAYERQIFNAGSYSIIFAKASVNWPKNFCSTWSLFR